MFELVMCPKPASMQSTRRVFRAQEFKNIEQGRKQTKHAMSTPPRVMALASKKAAFIETIERLV